MEVSFAHKAPGQCIMWNCPNIVRKNPDGSLGMCRQCQAKARRTSLCIRCANFAGKDADGKRHGARGMCWKCLSRERRAGTLVRLKASPGWVPSGKCVKCGSPKVYKNRALQPHCKRCYERVLLETSPNRDSIIESKRQSQRECRAANKLRLQENPNAIKHGTIGGYTYHGCRCEECSEARRKSRKRAA